MSTMSPAIAAVEPASPTEVVAELAPPAPTLWRMVLSSRRVVIGGGTLAAIVVICVATLPWTLSAPGGKATLARYLVQNTDLARHPPKLWPVQAWFGYDSLGRSVFIRSLMGGTISLAVGAAAAAISVALGVAVGLLAGYRGGWVDSALMRFVDIMYGLPYILLVILFKIAFEQPLTAGFS